MVEEQLIARRVRLPYTVPPGGVAVVLADGRVVSDSVQGPGVLDPEEWREHGRCVEAVLFPAAAFRLRFDVSGLPTAEGVHLDLTVILTLRIDNPVYFLTDMVRGAERFTEADLAALLRDAVRTGLAQDVARRSMVDLYDDVNLRGWLGTAIEHYLTAEADLLGRSGLTVVGVDAFGLHCLVWDEEQRVQEDYYLRATLAQAEAAGKKFLDEQLLAVWQAHLPVKAELVGTKEELAALTEREAAADARFAKAQQEQYTQRRPVIVAHRSAPSALRPELWRVALDEEASTAPLADEQRVYVATKRGRVLAFDQKTGQAAWPQPAELGASPGDGLALAAGCLWVPGHDGTLYGLDPANGAVAHRLPIGGRLSSAPLLAGERLYLGVDVDAATLRPGAGDVVAVDPKRGKETGRWTVSRYGLRAQPALWGQALYIGDRHGGLYTLDLRQGQIEALPARGGRITAAALVDADRGQVIAGDSYGWLLALDRVGRERWAVRLEGAVVGRPLLHAGRLTVGAGDGRVYTLDPATGRQISDPFQTRGAIATPPVAWRDLVFVGSNDGYLYAIEAGSSRCFWQYPSGSPVSVPPAVTPDGRLYVVDSAGHLNALRWCLARYTEGARRAEDAAPPRFEEAVDLWLLAGEAQAAIEAAGKAHRPDLVADLAMSLNWYDQAAKSYAALARRMEDPMRAAEWWTQAAVAWELAGRPADAEQCSLFDAQARRAPLLKLEAANLPMLTWGQPDQVQVRVANRTKVLACDVVLAYSGHVQRAGELPLDGLGPHGERMVPIDIVPSKSGSAMLQVTVCYTDPAGQPQRPAYLEVRLKVAQPPEVHHHYHGPHVSGDGVIIVRGGLGGEGRQMRVQSGEDAIEIGSGGLRTCPACGRQLGADDRFCMGCGIKVNS